MRFGQQALPTSRPLSFGTMCRIRPTRSVTPTFFSGYFYPSDGGDIRFSFDYNPGDRSVWRRIGAGPYITETFEDSEYIVAGLPPPLSPAAMDLASATFPYLESPVQVFYVDSGEGTVPAAQAAHAAEAILPTPRLPSLTYGPTPTPLPPTSFDALVRQARVDTLAGAAGANGSVFVPKQELLWYDDPIYGRQVVRRLNGSERLLAVVPKDSLATILFSRSVRDGNSIRHDAEVGLVSLALRQGLRLYESAIMQIDARAFVTEMLVERPTMSGLRFANDLTGFFSIFLGLTFFSVVIAPTNLFAFGFVNQWTKRRRARRARLAAQAAEGRATGASAGGAAGAAVTGGRRGPDDLDGGDGGGSGGGSGSGSDGSGDGEELENRTRLWVGIEHGRQQEEMLPQAPWLSDLRNGIRRRRRERRAEAEAVAATLGPDAPRRAAGGRGSWWPPRWFAGSETGGLSR
eukprot:TRINITY_DN232_c0_g1_i6.p1 TRINITY_DN232_c0_g1~~TRINITY_DN232_c0_g1_i6.p1  ORF type:complete len:461 (+),score=176.19 TRINITY_DN232_c0_g1_i6:732-2114(+)